MLNNIERHVKLVWIHGIQSKATGTGLLRMREAIILLKIKQMLVCFVGQALNTFINIVFSLNGGSHIMM